MSLPILTSLPHRQLTATLESLYGGMSDNHTCRSGVDPICTVASGQAIWYFRHYPRDRTFLKVMVSAVLSYAMTDPELIASVQVWIIWSLDTTSLAFYFASSERYVPVTFDLTAQRSSPKCGNISWTRNWSRLAVTLYHGELAWFCVQLRNS